MDVSSPAEAKKAIAAAKPETPEQSPRAEVLQGLGASGSGFRV